MKYSVDAFDLVRFGVETTAIHLVCGVLGLILEGYAASYGGSLAVFRILTMAVLPTVLLWFLTKPIPAAHYESGGGATWLKKALCYFLPGELFRYLFNLLPISLNRLGLILGRAAQLLYAEAYVRPAGRYGSVFEGGNLYPSDYAVYALCYLPYLAVWLTVECAVYRVFWMRAEREHAEMHRNDAK